MSFQSGPENGPRVHCSDQFELSWPNARRPGGRVPTGGLRLMPMVADSWTISGLAGDSVDRYALGITGGQLPGLALLGPPVCHRSHRFGVRLVSRQARRGRIKGCDRMRQLVNALYRHAHPDTTEDGEVASDAA